MSTTTRFNITLPSDVAQKLRATKNHSRVVAESLRDTFARAEQQRLQAILARGYAARAKADAMLNQEFDHMTGEGVE